MSLLSLTLKFAAAIVVPPIAVVYFCKTFLSFEPDPRESNEIFNLYGTSKYLERSATDLFGDEWDIVCIVPPGSSPARWVPMLLWQQNNRDLGIINPDKIDIKDPDEFGEYIWKVVLIDGPSLNTRLLQLHKNDFYFGNLGCSRLAGRAVSLLEEREIINGAEVSRYLVRFNKIDHTAIIPE